MMRALSITILLIFVSTKFLLAQCVVDDSMTATPMPVNGEYQAGQTVQFCYTINSYDNLSTNWHLGIGVQLGAGWDASSLTPVGQPASQDGNGTWLWLNNVTSSQTGQTSNYWGWYYDSSSGSPAFSQDGNPGNNYGDCCGGPWTYCWSATTSSCPPGSNGADLGIIVHNYADGELGSWTNFDCGGDPNYTFNASLSCIQCGTPTATTVQNETCPGDLDGEVTVSMNGGNPPFNYSWDTTPIQNTQTASGLGAGTYTVTVTDADQCVVTATATVTTGSSFDATMNNINPTNELCSDDAAVQITTIEPGGTFSGTGVNATGLFDPSTASIGINTVTYTVGNTCPDIQTMDVTVFQTADATIDPINPTNQICTGNPPVQLSAATTGGTWSGNGVSAGGIFDPVAAGTGTHTITYTIADPCGDIQTIDITVGDLTFTTDATASVCTADNGTATINPVTGTAPYTYNWATNPVQTTQSATDLAAGDYDVTIEDDNGCSVSTTVTVPFDPGDLAVAINAQTDASCNGICDGEATALASGGTAPILYGWDDPNNQLTATASDLCAGTYNVGVVDANGCLATAQVEILEPTALSVTAVMDEASDCGQANGEATATALGGVASIGYQYSWGSTPVQNTVTATGLLPATYTVTATDDNGCTATNTVDITTTQAIAVNINSSTNTTCFQGCDGVATATPSGNAVAPVTYSWNSTPPQLAATAAGLCAGEFVVTATDNVGCIATDTIVITEPTEVVSTVSATETQICVGQSTDLSSTTSGGTPPVNTLTWTASPADPTLVTTSQNPTVSPIVTTTYEFVAEDANGCTSATQSIVVNVAEPLDLSITRPAFSSDTSICRFDAATIDLEATGGDGNYSIFLLPDVSTPVQLPMQVLPNTTTTYDFMVEDGCGTPEAYTTSVVTVHQLPTPNFVSDVRNGCQPLTVQFTDVSAPTPVGWDWNFGDAGSNTNTSQLQSPTHTFEDAGLYDINLSITSAEGCTNDTTFLQHIEVYPLPYANFEAAPQTTTLLEGRVEFTDLTIGDVAEWDWSFGDGEVSDLQNPENTYLDTGSFMVNLHVVTTDGCEGSDRQFVVIEPDFMFYVPNAFSPNGDGKNDSFRGYGTNVKWETYEMSIYNRWGEEIYFTNNVDEPWNGIYKGAQAPEEVYVWMIQLFDQKGEKHTFRGRVTLFR